MVLPAQRAQDGAGPEPGREALLRVHQDAVPARHHALDAHLDLAVHHRPAEDL